ncbi:MAG: 1-acyl-sn-glycerol-3-phosphate acyltransferase, partial [Candidatus Marinimicrobia bacterium]|nr:1-acyl-sn-glycerol-3-phosphate acyltransferase [Candidatus Neomarinimicrobiota bacterium]
MNNLLSFNSCPQPEIRINMPPMQKNRQYILNFCGFVIKLSTLPILLASFRVEFTQSDPKLVESAATWLLVSFGALGMLYSDLLILRFGDGILHFSRPVTRLVDVGFYARNRHPSFWFLSIYTLGIILLFGSFFSLSMLLWVGILTVCILYLIFIQEQQLTHSLGQRYQMYQQQTPFWYWKLKIPKNQAVRLLPQLIWVFGMLVLRNWYRIKIEGSENIPHERPFIVVANHESYIDPFFFSLFLRYEIQFVTTADVFTTPTMRFLLNGIGTFPMRRHRQDLKSIRTMIRLVKSGGIVGIFPEGGRCIDGSPLPILKETLKLIQHSKVPILPIHLEGAYEIWPRWAANRRRGRITAKFNPIIPVADQTDLRELEGHIQRAIFAKEKIFSRVKTRNIAQGLDHFLWACNKCHAHSTIAVTSHNSIHCGNCHSDWHVSDDYTLIDEDTSQTSTLISWMAHIKSAMLEYQPELDRQLVLKDGEQAALNSKLDKYMSEDGVTVMDDLDLTLTSQRLIMRRKAELLDSWFMENITIFTLDY